MAILDRERSSKWCVLVCAFVIQIACLAQAPADNTKAWALPVEADVAQYSQWESAVPGAQRHGAALDNGLVLVVVRPGSEGAELYVKDTNWIRRALLVVSGRDTDPASSIEKVAVVRTDKGAAALKLTIGSVDAQITRRLSKRIRIRGARDAQSGRLRNVIGDCPSEGQIVIHNPVIR